MCCSTPSVCEKKQTPVEEDVVFLCAWCFPQVVFGPGHQSDWRRSWHVHAESHRHGSVRRRLSEGSLFRQKHLWVPQGECFSVWLSWFRPGLGHSNVEGGGFAEVFKDRNLQMHQYLYNRKSDKHSRPIIISVFELQSELRLIAITNCAGLCQGFEPYCCGWTQKTKVYLLRATTRNLVAKIFSHYLTYEAPHARSQNINNWLSFFRRAGAVNIGERWLLMG